MSSQKTSANTAASLILSHEIIADIGVPVADALLSRISARIEEAVNQLVHRERERCVALCKKRASLWSNTTMATTPMGREESRARANEATYIADAIRSD
jgi:hypothetical protein